MLSASQAAEWRGAQKVNAKVTSVEGKGFVRYEYAVNGKRYRSAEGSRRHERAHYWSRGDLLQVYYNPVNPANSAIDLERVTSGPILMGLFSAISFLGALIAPKILSAYRKL